MESKRIISSFLRFTEKAGIGNLDQSSLFLQVPEATELCFRVCTRLLSELRRTTVADMRIGEPTIGSYLLLRTVQPTITSSINFGFGRNLLVLVEDHCKNLAICCLYAHVHLRTETEIPDLLPVNTVFLLKEPFLGACCEQLFLVGVGSPSDFVVVGPSHVLYGDAEALGWREKQEVEGQEIALRWTLIGENLYRNGKFPLAADAYFLAMNSGGDIATNHILNLQLARVLLVLGCYERAIQHCHKVLENTPLNEIALYHMSLAYYELRRFREAKVYIEKLRPVVSSNETVLSEMVRCEDRIREAEGNVDISKLFLACQTDVTTPIDHANFCEYVKFRSGPSNVRGVFATQDMEPGTLILVEKPLVVTFLPNSSSERGLFRFMQTALRAVLNNPKTLGSKLYGLPGGGTLTEENKRIFCDEVTELEPILDVRILYQIIQKNIFKNKNNMAPNPQFSYQVYELASRFQHSCLSNCTFVVYKDVITVRTCTPVSKGEELFLRYYGNHLSFREKQVEFERNGFSCGCSLCALDKMESTEVHDLREELKTKFYMQLSLYGRGPEVELNLLPIVKELELTYRDRNSLRHLLFFVYCDLAKIVDRNSEDRNDKVSCYVETGLRSVSLSTDLLFSWADEVNPQIPQCVLVPEVLFEYAALMAEKESWNGRRDLVEKWVKVLLHLERVYRGGTWEMLMQRFSDFSEAQSLLSVFSKYFCADMSESKSP